MVNSNIERSRVVKKDATETMVAARPEIRKQSTEASKVLREYMGGKVIAALHKLSKTVHSTYKTFAEGMKGLEELTQKADEAGKTVAGNRYAMEIEAKKKAYPEFAKRFEKEQGAA